MQMKKQIAFLRAINVTNRYVKMDVLRQHFENMDFENVSTYIQSGNVIFETMESDHVKLEQQIEAHLQDSLGFAVPAFVRSGDEFGAIANYSPFQSRELEANINLFVTFLKAEPDQELQGHLVSLSNEIDEFHFNGAQLYWLMYRNRGESKFTNAKIERLLKAPATRRNTTTLRKIAKKYKF